MREAKARKTAWEKRTKKDIVPGAMIVIITMLYGKLDKGINNDVTSIAGDKAGEDFDLMKSTIESLKQIDAKSKTVPMDLSMPLDHGTYVKWSDDGAPEDWQEEWPEGASDEAYWDDGESYRFAAIVEAEQTLDALKRKGKGKGKKGKGRGKENNGKGKVKDGGKGQPPGKGTGDRRVDGARTEGRQCFNCWEWGHLGKDCSMPDRHKSVKRLDEKQNSDTASIASSAHGSACSLTTARMQLCTVKIRPDDS